MRTSKFVTISLPPQQLRVAERLAKKQSRTMSELFREGLRRLEQEDRQRQPPIHPGDLGAILRAIQQSAKAAGLDKMTSRDIDAEIAAARRDMQPRAKKTARKRSR